jgi:hypothetical protein
MTNKLIDDARDIYACQDIQIEDNAATAEGDDGTWVAAWVFVPKEDAQ